MHVRRPHVLGRTSPAAARCLAYARYAQARKAALTAYRAAVAVGQRDMADSLDLADTDHTAVVATIKAAYANTLTAASLTRQRAEHLAHLDLEWAMANTTAGLAPTISQQPAEDQT